MDLWFLPILPLILLAVLLLGHKYWDELVKIGEWVQENWGIAGTILILIAIAFIIYLVLTNRALLGLR